MRGSEGSQRRWEASGWPNCPWGPSPGRAPPGALRSRSAAARTPTKASPGSNITIAKRALWPSCGRLASRALTRGQDTQTRTHTHRPTLLFPSQMPKLLRAGAARRLLAHLIQAVDFLRGIHDFPAAGALGVHCRGSRGRRLGGSNDGWGLRGAAVTSPGEPRTASGQAGGRRGPGAGVWRRRGARGERAARRAGRRRGRGWVRGGAWRRGTAALSGSAPARAPRRSLCVARAPGTGDSHRHSLPPLALTRSPASPPRRRPNPPARPDRSDRERARWAPGRAGEAGEGGGQTQGKLRRPRGLRPGGLEASVAPLPQRGRPGGRRRRRGEGAVGVRGRGAGRAQTRALTAALPPVSSAGRCSPPLPGRLTFPVPKGRAGSAGRGCARPPPPGPRVAGSGAPTPAQRPVPGRRLVRARAATRWGLGAWRHAGNPETHVPAAPPAVPRRSHGPLPRESVPRVPARSARTLDGKRRLSLAPHHCTFCICSWRTTGHFRPESSPS